MKIWFGCTTLDWGKYRSYYFQIRQTLIDNECIILHDWIKYADEVFEAGKGKESRKRDLDYVLSAIRDADRVVIEYTVPNFSTTHQINYALQRQKPTLVLQLSKPDSIFTEQYIETIDSPHLQVVQYSKDTCEEIIKSFLSATKQSTKFGRYNVVLSSKHKYYLDWAKIKYGLSKSEIIREVLDKKMDKDVKFQKYLNGPK